MIKTRITEAFGLTAPILSAGMAFVARHELAAAVSNAGGMGFLGADMTTPEGVTDFVRATRGLTSRPFGIDFMVPFFTEEHLQVCLAEPVAVVNFIWGYPQWEWVEKLQNAGSQVWMSVHSVDEAKGAMQCGLDALIVQATDGAPGCAGASLMALLPAVVDAVSLPLIASGSIVDGRGLAASLTLGAEAVRCGTRFLSAREADAQSEYDRRVGAAWSDSPETNLFSREWPDSPAPPRSRTVEWSGYYGQANATAAGSGSGAKTSLPRVPGFGHRALAVIDSEGAIDAAAVPEENGSLQQLQPAAEIVREMTAEAEEILAKYSSLRAVA